jgi:hypothetical protein
MLRCYLKVFPLDSSNGINVINIFHHNRTVSTSWQGIFLRISYGIYFDVLSLEAISFKNKIFVFPDSRLKYIRSRMSLLIILLIFCFPNPESSYCRPVPTNFSPLFKTEQWP